MKRFTLLTLTVLLLCLVLPRGARAENAPWGLQRTYLYTLRNAYPTMDPSRCAAPLMHALFAWHFSQKIDGESERLRQLNCFDKYSGFELRQRIWLRPLDAVVTFQSILNPGSMRYVESKELHSGVRYIRIKQFGRSSGAEFAWAAFFRRGLPSRLVFDLRNNPGGSIEAAFEVLNTFAPFEGVLSVSIVSRHGVIEDNRARARGPLAGVSVAVLVNEKSASASELVAGTLALWTRAGLPATLMGTKTNGKGRIQAVIPVTETLVLRVTVGEYFIGGDLDKGKVQDRGLYPSLFLPPPGGPLGSAEDMQLQLAVKHLLRR